MFSFVKPTKRVLCPYCLAEIRYKEKITRCENKECNEELPPIYVQDFEKAFPFFVQLIGWSQVGKTTYIQALTVILESMHRFWHNQYACMPLTQYSLDYIKNIREFLVNGKLFRTTPGGLQPAYIMQLANMDKWGWRSLVTRDIAGELLVNLQLPIQYLPYMVHVPTTLMMISLPDLRQNVDMRMNDLMTSYVNTLSREWPNYRNENRNVIVILSKADEYINDLPEDLQKYLISDPFAINSPSFKADKDYLTKYISYMSYVSKIIKGWICEYPGGRMLMNIAQINQINLEFSLVSSIGSPNIVNGVVKDKINPLRVLDPYFWALEKQSKL